jgi:hypothetical protein
VGRCDACAFAKLTWKQPCAGKVSHP